MTDPWRICEVIEDTDHAPERRWQRSLPFRDMEMMIRIGDKQNVGDNIYNVVYNETWTIRVKLGKCTISVVTPIRKR